MAKVRGADLEWHERVGASLWCVFDCHLEIAEDEDPQAVAERFLAKVAEVEF